jgi:rod shape-determining protein MreB
MISGLPREVIITDSDIREAISSSLNQLADGVKEVLETTPPEILGDIMHRGIILSGGGALLNGLDIYLQNLLKIPIYVAEDPLTAVARGCGVILDDLDYYREVLIENQDAISPR